MSNTTKVVALAIAAVVIITGITFLVSGKQTTSLSGEPIKIGAVLGLTGAASTWGDMSKKGIDLAIQEANDAGGINGRKIEVVYEDSQTNPSKGVSAFNKLVSVDHVSLVFGDVWSYLTNPLIPLADQQKALLISPTVTDASVEKPSPYFYTVGHTIASKKEAEETFFDTNKDVKTISVLYWNDFWGNANKDLLLSVAKEKGVKILSIEGTNDFTATYQAEMTKIKASNPDAIYFGTALPDVVLRKIKDIGLGDKKVLTSSEAVEAIEVTKTPVPYLKNVYFANWVPDAEFTAKFRKAYGVYPIIETQDSYDMARAVVSALKGGGDLSSSLKAVKFTGVEGYPIDFTQGDQIRVNGGQAGLYTYDGTYREVR